MYWCFQESEQNACETDALETRLYFDFADGDTSLKWTIILEIMKARTSVYNSLSKFRMTCPQANRRKKLKRRNITGCTF